MSLKIAGFSPLVMRVSDVTSNVRLPMVKVIALVSTLSALPEATSVVFTFLGLTGALVAGVSATGAAMTGGAAGGASGTMLVASWPRESTGAADSAQTAIVRIILFILNFGLIFYS